ncbi:MAG: hypothetical protein HWQ41_00460 [Nostoc sp. NOS(2021)]|uniref:hypothetical protein n=1 Tax=Nostoc sp. NOS(2021) TaxID=2815407 RepID=UPI0025CDF6C3|nr:hypothetical protein [Nostoc sp. NOS(2021)]MBN3893816.1 hypothetical protein [Nostoc sp. NOS(2021)]
MDFRKFYIPTVMAGLALLTCSNQAQAQTTSDLTGTWYCGSTRGVNYIRQVGSELWDLSDGGYQYTNTFNGTVLNGFINATWADLPKAGYTNYGYVSGHVVSATQITLTYTYASTGDVGLETCTR